MRIRICSILLAGLVLASPALIADAPLKTVLDLTMEQARQVTDIQAQHRKQFAVKRQQRNRDLRKLRCARFANDAQAVSELEAITEKQLEELRQIRRSEDAAICKLLNPEQTKKFDAFVKQRKAMVGSSRDDADL